MKFRALICIIISVLLCVIFAHKPEQKITLQFATWGSESELKILKPLLNEYKAENPDTIVELLHIPQNYFQKIHLLFASNTAPDVIFINNQYLPIYANAGVLEDLTPYSKELELENFYEKSIDSMKWKNKIYAVPRDISNLVVYYNKDLFNKNNIKYPNNNWNFNDFLNTAKRLTQNEVFGVSFDEEPLYYIQYMTSVGGWTKDDTQNYFKQNVLNSPQNKYGLNFYADLRKKYHYAPRREDAGSATMAQMFLQGKIGMYISGRWMVPKIRQEAKFDWDIAEFPSGKTGGSIPLDASGWAISKNSKHKIQALSLIKFLSSEKSSQLFTSSGLIVPARKNVANSNIFLDNKKPKNSIVFLKIIEKSIPTPVTINYREILDDLKIKTEYLFN